jgi:hypothetical protein
LDELFGDGVVLRSSAGETTAELSSCHISHSARAGLGLMGATASLHATTLSCNTIDLVADPHLDRDAVLTDAGDNHCVCGEEEHPCMALSAGLQPPEPAEPDAPPPNQ